MKLCTFEVRTHLGRHARLGAVVPAGIIDLNFACAARLAAAGEPRAHKLADALAPGNMREFLEGEARAMTAARDAIRFLEQTGERRGPNDETLVYAPAEVKLLAPLPNPASVRDFYAFEAHVKKGFEKRGEPMPAEWYQYLIAPLKTRKLLKPRKAQRGQNAQKAYSWYSLVHGFPSVVP